MATITAVLRKKANKDGSYPLAIRITKDRKSSFMHLGYHVFESDWLEDEQMVKTSHPNSKRLNNLILKKKVEASDKALELESQNTRTSAKVIRLKIKPQASSMFHAQAKLYLQRLVDKGNYNRFSAEKSRIKIFMMFINGIDINKGKPTGKKDEDLALKDIAFYEISTGLLERFKIELISKRSAGARTVMNYMMDIRSVFSFAKKDGVIDGKHYPFGDGQVVIKFPDTKKVAKSQDDVKKLECVNLSDSTHDHARNLWLMSYYFAGMRIADVLQLRWSDFVDMRLHYTMGKNNKSGSVAVLDKAFAIMEKYLPFKENYDDLVFPDLKEADFSDKFELQRLIAQANNWNNKILKRYVAPSAGIEGKLTMHLSRHTFASEAADKVPVKVLQMLYRHSDVRTTIGYQTGFIHTDADIALKNVIG